MWLQEQVSLKNLNTLGIHARARYYVRIDTAQDLVDWLAHPSFRILPRLILGGGSNVLFLKDFEGIVVHLAIGSIAAIREDRERVWVQAGAGVGWHQLVQHCVDKGYAGIENLSLIPGTVGAAPIQNIGAYGVELGDVLESLTALEIGSGKVRTFDREACELGYRDSIFKNELRGQYIILSVTLRLRKKPIFQITYGAIQSALEAMNIRELSIKAISDAVIHIRQNTLPDPAHLGNAGSFFKNPVILQSRFEQLQKRYPHIPGYAQPRNYVKVPAAWLIEQCGWKGTRRGQVGVHKQQALVLVNYGGGTGKDIHQLAEDIQQSIKKRFRIELSPEVDYVA